MYAVKFIFILLLIFVACWLVVGVVFTAFIHCLTNWPVMTVAFIFMAYLFLKEATR